MTAQSLSDIELRRLIEGSLEESRGAPVSVSLIERHVFDRATSYALELLRVHIGNAESVEVVVKDFGTSRLPKDDPKRRAEREAAVYRELLTGSEVGTARLYGVLRHPVRLVLEHVDGTNLKYHDLETWIEAASWLGGFQAGMENRSEQVHRCRSLIRHDRAFFIGRVRAARTAIQTFGRDAANRLGALLDGYGRLIEMMVDQPETLVHGSFRPQNIIVSKVGNAPVRICPVDWELAGLGSPLYDLAFLAEGFHGPDLDRLFAAYFRGRGHPERVSRQELEFTVDCFRLHKVVKSVGDSQILAFRPATIEKLLTMGTELRERLG